MKTTFSQMLFCSLILAFTAGCGKDSKSSSSGTNYNGVIAPGTSVTVQEEYNKNVNWFNGNVEGAPLYGLQTVKKTKSIYNTGPTCVKKEKWGVPYTSCTYSGGPVSTEVISSQSVAFVNDGVVINTRGNMELNTLFGGQSGTLLNAQIYQYNPNQSLLEFLRSDGVVVSYLIDRSVNSKLNPRIIQETSSTQKTVIQTTP
jgi:hypothetical protein